MPLSINAQLLIAQLHHSYLTVARRAEKAADKRIARVQAAAVEAAEQLAAGREPLDFVEKLHGMHDDCMTAASLSHVVGLAKGEHHLFVARGSALLAVVDIVLADLMPRTVAA